LAELSLTRAWNETAAFVKQEAGLLLPVALLAVLPAVAVQLVVPEPPRGRLPEPGLWILLVLLAVLIAMTANIAISRLALRPGTSVGEALSHALRRLPAFLAAAIIVGIGFGLTLIVVGLVILIPTAGPGGQPSPLGTALVFLIAFPVVLYVGARLFLTTPVTAAEPGGPFAILRRSWALTADHAWTLIGLMILLVVLLLVVTLAVGTVAGILIALAAGPPRPGSVSAMLMLLVGAALNTVVTAYLTTLTARIYAQLAGDAASGI